MEFSTMKTLIEQIINSKSYVKEIYESNSNGPDFTICPFCQANEQVRFGNGGKREYSASINELIHDDDCIYSLINKLESTILNENINKQLDSIIIDTNKYNEEILYNNRDGELL